MYREVRSKTKLIVTQTFAHVYSARVEELGRRIVVVVVLINTHNILEDLCHQQDCFCKAISNTAFLYLVLM